MICNPDNIPTPCYVCDEAALEKNARLLAGVQERTGAKILLALKGFAMFSLFPLLRSYLSGTCASSPDEARLGYEEFGKEVHTYAPAYSDHDFPKVVEYSDHIVFNSFSQWQRFRPVIIRSGKKVCCGIRINPEYSEVRVARYNPCVPSSRLGIIHKYFVDEDLTGISGLHLHTHCEQNSDVLKRTMQVVEKKFGSFLRQMKWINLGGGHHITRAGYDVDTLCEVITGLKERYDVEVYLEPGEAVALNAGVLVASVLDIVRNEMDIAILDTSATAHMPDVLEMPYRPEIVGSGKPGDYPYTYRLGGMTCLAGDVIGDYSFPTPLQVGTRLVFQDMVHYTMVKNTTFNGVRLPSIGILSKDSGQVRIVRTFSYVDYKNRLS